MPIFHKTKPIAIGILENSMFDLGQTSLVRLTDK